MAATGTATSTEKGRRIVGSERQTLAKDLVSDTPPARAFARWPHRPAGPTDSCTGCSPSPACSCASAAAPAVARRRDDRRRRHGLAVTLTEAGVRYEQDGPVATVTLCRPDVLNAQTPAMWAELGNISRKLPGDVRVVIVRGEGRAFSAGLDLSVARGDGDSSLADLARLSPAECADRIAGFQAAFTWLRRPSLVTIAAVQGHAIGAGFQLALELRHAGARRRRAVLDGRGDPRAGARPGRHQAPRRAGRAVPGAGDLRHRPPDRRRTRRTGSAWPPPSCPRAELDGAVADLAAAVLAARPRARSPRSRRCSPARPTGRTPSRTGPSGKRRPAACATSPAPASKDRSE